MLLNFFIIIKSLKIEKIYISILTLYNNELIYIGCRLCIYYGKCYITSMIL